ncbi:transcription antitermination factor NusB [Peptococcaceae bacterium 1198_IL3148]
MSRRQARETALQVLFAVDVGKIELDQAFNYVVEEFNTSLNARQFARELLEGAIKYKDELDAIIARLSKGWEMKRLASVDRNIMRLALYELIYRDDIPPAVSVNEAVEMAKLFGGEKSGKFVNGILGQVVEKLAEFKLDKEPFGT